MMTLRNLMEDKQLDFNQPLLSVRRFSSTGMSSEAKKITKTEPEIPPLPVYKSELKSGPVRNPGTVPFIWEQTPGKPKDESKKKSWLFVRPPLAPKLPPGRVPNIKQEVPMSVNAASSDEIANEIWEEKASSGSGNDEEEEDEVYRDAMDRFSRSESFFLNCSISGVSGLDGSEIKHSEAFMMDPESRDFMMDRFLPAAKAMASETPPHVIRKQTVPLERPREIKMVTNGVRQRQPNPYVHAQHVQEICREESEEEDDCFDQSGYSSARGCGFLPRFCLLNPVPGMRMQATSVRRNRNSSTGNSRDAVSQKRSSHSQGKNWLQLEENVSPCQSSGKSNIQEPDTLYRQLQGMGISNLQNEPPQTISEKATKAGANEPEPCRRSQSNFQELLDDESGSASPVIEKTLYIDSVHKIKSPNASSNSFDMNGIKNFGAYIPDDASVNSAETKEMYLMDSATQDTGKLNPDEKTSVRPNSMESVDSCSPKSSGRSFCEVTMDLNCSRFNQEHVQNAEKLTSLQFSDDKKFDLESQFPLKPSNQGASDVHSDNIVRLTSSDGTYSEEIDVDRKQPEKSSLEQNNLTTQEYSKKLESDGRRLKESGSQESFHGFSQDSPDLRTSKNAANCEIDPKDQFLRRESNKDSSNGFYSRLPFAPPPTKSPSESWLKRTLPTSRNSPFLRSSLAMQKNPMSLTSSPNPMWESTVKRSNTIHQHPHQQFSHELLSSIPEV